MSVSCVLDSVAIERSGTSQFAPKYSAQLLHLLKFLEGNGYLSRLIERGA